MDSRRRKEARSSGGSQGSEEREDAKKKAASAAAAAARKSQRAETRSLWGIIQRGYRRADEVVSMPFLIALGIGLALFVGYGQEGRGSRGSGVGGWSIPDDPGEGGHDIIDWKWLQGKVCERCPGSRVHSSHRRRSLSLAPCRDDWF